MQEGEIICTTKQANTSSKNEFLKALIKPYFQKQSLDILLRTLNPEFPVSYACTWHGSSILRSSIHRSSIKAHTDIDIPRYRA